ncbi:MAG: hypothetical protein ORN26_01015, partial [Candidatus Pacebacteria bacterium]|nr:hypothetical protein [Candidatus Paceibacterota bacterium]
MNGAPEAKGKGEQNPISPENVENKVLTSEEEAQRMEQMDEKYAKTSEKKADMATLGKIESSLPSDVQALKNKTLIKLSNGRFLCLGVDEKGYNIGVLLSLSVDANNLENGGLKIADSEYIDTKEDKAVMAQLGVDEAEFRKIIYFEDKWVDENTDRKNAEKAKEEIDKQINKITEEYFTNKISPLD